MTNETHLDQDCINTIRMLSVDAVQQANSGHPGTPMALAPLGYLLWTRFLKHNPSNPKWRDRDRFVLSAGHASMLLYSLLHLTGYDLSLEELRQFRQWGSLTPGHPEYRHTPGVETTTGPLGQGFANAVGFAMTERFLAERFNRPNHSIVDHYTYCIASDGDLMEGVSGEAASLAGGLKLGKLICFYDDNRITIEGSTELAFWEDVAARFKSYGWHVVTVPGDGNDLKALEKGIQQAQHEKDRPSLVVVRTHIGYGSPNRQDTAKAHGEALGVEEVKLTKDHLDWPQEPTFHIPPEALKHFRKVVEKGRAEEKEWDRKFEAYAKAHSELAKEWHQAMDRRLPTGWDSDLEEYAPKEPMATRQAFGQVLNLVAQKLPSLVGGSADLAPSNNTTMKGLGSVSGSSFSGRNLHFGVREHAMGSILNGMALHGGVIPYAGTFLIFSDYMRPAIRLAALMEIPTTYIFTHDSIGLGEDGPTHQPIEQLSGLRAIPNMTVIRPADAMETAVAWRMAIENTGGPMALILSRQKLPIIDRNRTAPAEGVLRGAYILTDCEGRRPDIILIGTGSELHLVLQAGEKLAEEDIAVRVVSMPSCEIFDKQPIEYRDSVLPPDLSTRIVVEAASPFGWDRYVGGFGDIIGINRFGASAPYERIMKELGFSVENIVSRAKAVLSRTLQTEGVQRHEK